MNIRQLLGPNVNEAFASAASEASYRQGYADYPSFDLRYQHDPDYSNGYCVAYHDDQDEKEHRRLTDERYPRSAEIDRKNGF